MLSSQNYFLVKLSSCFVLIIITWGKVVNTCVRNYFCPLIYFSMSYRYSNFISSSELVASVQGRTNMCDLLRIMGSDITPTSSPTSGHLTTILNLLTQLMKIVRDFITRSRGCQDDGVVLILCLNIFFVDFGLWMFNAGAKMVRGDI